MKTEEINKTISLFMDLKESVINEGYWYSEQYGYTLPKYDKEWSWLMPAIIKAQVEYKYVTGDETFELQNESKKLAQFLIAKKNEII
mgnify:CR=1 FL=1